MSNASHNIHKMLSFVLGGPPQSSARIFDHLAQVQSFLLVLSFENGLTFRQQWWTRIHTQTNCLKSTKLPVTIIYVYNQADQGYFSWTLLNFSLDVLLTFGLRAHLVFSYVTGVWEWMRPSLKPSNKIKMMLKVYQLA